MGCRECGKTILYTPVLSSQRGGFRIVQIVIANRPIYPLDAHTFFAK
jgi:hypothetical protein